MGAALAIGQLRPFALVQDGSTVPVPVELRDWPPTVCNETQWTVIATVEMVWPKALLA